MEENSLTIVKSNKLIEASYRLGLDEQRLLLSCIGKIDSRSELDKQDRFKITAKDFSQYSGVDMRNAYQQIESAAEHLFERKISLYDNDTNSLLITRWVSSVKYNQNHGYVEICFAQDVIPLISQLKGQFTKYKLENVAKLTSIHAIRTYELCLQYLTIGSRKMSVDEYRYYLGLEDSYLDFKIFNRDVLKKSIDQINKHTDLKIKVSSIKEGRKVVFFKFDIESKQARGHKVSKQKAESEIKKLSSSIKDSSKKQTKQQRPSFVLGESYH